MATIMIDHMTQRCLSSETVHARAAPRGLTRGSLRPDKRMIDYVAVTAAAFLASGLTVFTGFGLGTLLLPVFALFFPVEVAVAATAVVHGANSLFRALLFGRSADRTIVVRFGIPAILAALLGAAVLGMVSGLPELVEYRLGSREASITPVKLVLAVLMIVFALFELVPRLRSVEFDRSHLTLGGILSGFFGGLSGHQGALRSAFLAKVGITPEAFVGTTAVVSLLVDVTRIAAYSGFLGGVGFVAIRSSGALPLVGAGVLAAIAGILIAKTYVRAVTMRLIQTLTGVMLVGIALALGSGLI